MTAPTSGEGERPVRRGEMGRGVSLVEAARARAGTLWQEAVMALDTSRLSAAAEVGRVSLAMLVRIEAHLSALVEAQRETNDLLRQLVTPAAPPRKG